LPPPESLSDIDRWFKRTGRTENRIVSLYPSLLTGRTSAYLRYRMRYPLILSTVQFGAHVAEFFLILSSLGGMAALTVMVLRVGSLGVGGAWWGLLEVMRERLRKFSRAGNRDASEYEIGRWLVLAAVVGVVVTVGAGLALVLLRPSGDHPVAHLYAFLIVLELAANFPVRVLHSGVYATRRVYRPPWSVFVSPAMQLAVLVVGFYFYPTAAIIISIIAANALGIWITVRYSLEAYRLMGLRPKRPSGQSLWRQLPRIPLRLGLETTLAGLGMRLDAILVLAIAGVYGTNTRSFDLTAADSAWRHVDAFQFFYLILPLFRGTYESAGIFYFDFVRLRRHPELHEFRWQFSHKLLWLSPGFALYFWGLSALLGLTVLSDIPVTFLLALIPLFAVRSVIGIYQIRLFAEGRFGIHLASMAFLVVLLWLVWIKPDPASDLVQITAAMIAQLILLINLQHVRDRREPPLPTMLTMGDWLGTLICQPGPVLVGTATIPDSVTTKQRSATLEAVRQLLCSKGYFAFRSPKELLYFESDDDNGRRPALALQAATGGALSRGRCVRVPTTNGRNAVDDVVWLTPIADASGDLGSLKAGFRAIFPDGIVFDLETLEGAHDMRALDQAVLARIVPVALTSIEQGAVVVAASGRWITPVYHLGTLRVIFILPADTDPVLLARWRDTVRAWRHG
jgi:hypothetical protein